MATSEPGVYGAADHAATPKSASRRSSRRSWFDTPPATSRDIAVERQPPLKTAGSRNKRRSMEDVETLVLSHFTKPPRIGFGKIIVGRSKTRVLLVQNPADYEQEVVIERFPHKKGFNVDQTHFVVEPEEVVTLTLTWTPQDAGGCREMVLFHINDVYRLQAYMFGTADDPKPIKKGRKGMLGTRRKQPPSSVVQTKSLASIRDNYSPRRSEELRELRSHIKPPAGPHVDNQENISPGELDDQVPHTPPPLESTAICRGDERHEQKVKERRKSGFISPTLSKMSPIPLTAGNNNGCIMESYISTTTNADFSPLHPRCTVPDTDRSPLKNVTQNDNKASGSANLHGGQPDRDKSDKYRSKRSSGRKVSTEGEKPVVMEAKAHVSPSSFLNDSLAGTTMANTAAEVGSVCASYQVARVAEKVTISPNSFVQNMGSKQPAPLPCTSSIPSPSAVLNDSIPHTVMMKQLEFVRKSLHDGSFHDSPVLSSAVMTMQNKVASKPQPPARAADRLSQLAQPKPRNVFTHAQQQHSMPSKKDKFLHRKLQDKARFAKITDAPSPRRKTFLIKKQPARRLSPQKHLLHNAKSGTAGAAPRRLLINPTSSADVKKARVDAGRVDSHTVKKGSGESGEVVFAVHRSVESIDSRTVRKERRETEVIFAVHSNAACIPDHNDDEELTQDGAVANHRRSMWASPAVSRVVSPVIAVQSDCDSTGDERQALETEQALAQHVALTTELGEIPKSASQEAGGKGRQSSGRQLFPDIASNDLNLSKDDLNLSKDFRPLWSGLATVTKNRPSTSPSLSGSANGSKKLFPDINSTAATPETAPKSGPEALPQDGGEEFSATADRVRNADREVSAEAAEKPVIKQAAAASVEIVDMGVASSRQSGKLSHADNSVEIVDLASPLQREKSGQLLDSLQKTRDKSSHENAHPQTKHLSSFEWHSPQQLPQSPASKAGRRSTLTVTKSRPSQALLDACNNATGRNVVTEGQEATPETNQNDSDELWQSETIVIETKDNNIVSLTVHREVLTPSKLPTSPVSENSRRSTRSIKNPVIVNRDGMMPKNLFGSDPESGLPSGTVETDRHVSHTWGLRPKEEDEVKQRSDGAERSEVKPVASSRHSTAPSVKKSVSSPAVYTERTERHVSHQPERMTRPAQPSVPQCVLDGSVSSQELSSDSLETEKKSSGGGQDNEDSLSDSQRDCLEDSRRVSTTDGRKGSVDVNYDLICANEGHAQRQLIKQKSSYSETCLSEEGRADAIHLKQSHSHHVATKDTSAFLSNKTGACIAKEDGEVSASQKDMTESFTEISPFPSVTSVESKETVVEISEQMAMEHPEPTHPVARETWAKPVVTRSTVKETLLREKVLATATTAKTARSSSSAASTVSDQDKVTSSRPAPLGRSSSAEGLSSKMPPPQTTKTPAAYRLRQTAASHHKAKAESVAMSRGQSLPKTKTQGSLDRGKAKSQGNLDQCKTRSQGSLERTKTKSQGNLNHRKSTSQGNLDHMKTKSQGNLDHSKATSQGNLDHTKTRSQESLDLSKRRSRGYVNSSQVTEQQTTPLMDQQTEQRISRKRPNPEAGLKPPCIKRVELERRSMARGGQQKSGQGAASQRPRVGGKTARPARGVALSRLILVKKATAALPKHPLPFAAKNMYYDERWQDKQERGFVHWLNFVLTPADEYVLATTKTKVDARTIAFDGTAHQVAPRLAPTKEILSFRTYAARRRLNHLRRASCGLFQSEAVVRVVCRLELEVEQRRLAVRTDRMIHADIGLKQKILDLLLSYNPLWLRIGLETVYGEVLPISTNNDVIGISRFILTRLLTSPDISAHYAHPTVPHLYHDGYGDAVAQHMLKKLLVLVYFLDCAKRSRLIAHDPCLFCKDADIKSTKGLLIQFSRDFLSGEGDVTKHLAYMGYVVSHVQTPLDEFDYAVSNLCTDLRDGLRLARIVMLLSGDWCCAPSLRSPAISRLQKIHNVELVFKQLTQRGLDLHTDKGSMLNPRNIVEGHREKTLAFLWKLIFHFQAIATLSEQELQEEVAMLERTLRVKVCMQRMLGHPHDSLSTARRDSGGPSATMESPMLHLLLKWCRTVCLHYGVKVENFTVSFSDGRALCCLLHHYHPALLPLGAVHFRTSQSLQEAAESAATDRAGEDDSDLSLDWATPCPLGGDLDQSLFETLLANEKENFRVLYEKVSELGGIPLMLKAADMTNTIPDERVVITYVSYLCARLLDLREETQAARIIQLAWRRFCLRRSAQLRQKQAAACVVIQRAWRQYLVAMATKRQEAAAVCLQSMWRRRQAFRRVSVLRQIKKDRAMHKAATKIQTCVRCFLTRRHFQRQIHSAVVIQSYVRALKARRTFLQQRHACLTIQSHFRAHTQGANVRRQFVAQKRSAVVLQRAFRQRRWRQMDRQNRAASVLQSLWRGRKCRHEFLRRRQAALLIQARWRTIQARKRFTVTRTACIVIQRWFLATRLRGQVRQDFLQLRQAAMTTQKYARGCQQRRRFRQLSSCALTIQKRFRGYRCRVRFQALRLATIIIQRAVRAHQARTAARQQFVAVKRAAVVIQRWFRQQMRRQVVRREQAATLIQAVFRGHLARREVEALRTALRTEAAATLIQNWYRTAVARRRFRAFQLQVRKHQAALKIQASFRGLMARRQARLLRQEARRHQACITLQSAYRRYRAVQVVKGLQAARRREQAATTIQSAYRCYTARRRLLSARRERAAVRIQSAYRRHRAVQQLRLLQSQARQKTAAVRLQSAVRTFLARRKLQALRWAAQRESAAVRIQSAYRCFVAIKVLKALRLEGRRQAAATQIQCAYRRHVALKQLRALQLEARRQAAAAVKIQCAYRRCLAVRELRALQLSARRQASAIRIQSVYRGHVARTYVQTLKEAARRASAVTKIQAWIRGYQQRRHYLRVQRSVLVLQCHMRGCLTRKRYRETRELLLMLAEYHQTQEKFQAVLEEYHQRWNAAVTMQSAWRGWQQRQRFLKTRSSVCTLQATFRGCAQRKRFLLLKASAAVIQRWFRAHRLGRATRLRYKLMLGAAVVIQSYWKRYVIRSYYLQLRARVIRAQSQCRGYLARSRFWKQRQAALCLQRQFRAWAQGQRAYQTTRQVIVRLQARVRAKQQRERFLRQRQSCVLAQAAVRTWLAQRRYQRQSVVTLQRWWRAVVQGRKDRARYRQTRTAAVTLQAFTRGHLARQHLRCLKHAARVIQSRYRGYRARRQFLCVKTAAVTVQRQVRTFLHAQRQQRHVAVRQQACVTIQATYRGHLARQAFLRCRQSTITLQAWVRAQRQRRRYLALYNAVLLCQARYRAKCLGQVFRTAFLIIRQAAVIIQNHVRGYRARQAYHRQRSSFIVIQRHVRGWLQRRRWTEQKQAAVCLQRRWRAKEMGRVDRQKFLQTRGAMITLQHAWRACQQIRVQNAHRAATVLQKHVRRHLSQMRFRRDRQRIVQVQAAVRGFLTRREASKRLQAVNVIQRRWRETLLARQCHQRFCLMVRAAVVIQSVFRGHRCQVRFTLARKRVILLQGAVRGLLQRRRYLQLRQTAVTLQRRVRSNIVCRREHRTFLQQRRSAVIIQTAFRGWQRRHQERRTQAATCLQSYFRMRPVRTHFLRTVSAVITLQSAVRARRARHALRQKKAAVLLIQQRVRSYLLVRRLRWEVHRWRQAAMIIQRAFRNYVNVLRSRRIHAAVRIQAAVRGYIQRRKFLRVKQAALTLQCGVRGWRDRRRARERRVEVKAAVVMQRGFRAWKLRREEELRQQQRREYLQRYVDVAKRHMAVMRIQRWYRQGVLMRQARQQLCSVIVLQRCVRAFLQRRRLLRALQEAQVLQERREKAARVIQLAVRKWFLQQEERRRLRLITKIQAIWRGRQLRRGLKSKKIAMARRRVQEANEKAREEKTLGQRTASALDFLLHYKQLAYILDALMHLDTATRLSWMCCERLVEVNAVGVILRLILSCNRSLPHMELIKFSVSVLLNLAKYEKTSRAVYEAEDSVTTLVDLLSVYREKGGAIFTKTCMLLAILGADPQHKAEMCSDQKLVAKLQSVHALVLRKHRMQQARARVAARTSLNATLPSRLHGPHMARVRPAWVLRRDSMQDIDDPVAALSFLLDTLHIGPK